MSRAAPPPASIAILPTCPRGCAGGNGCCAPRRRSSPPRRRFRARRSRASLATPAGSTPSSLTSTTELKARPYEIVFVAGGYQFRTRPRHAEALRALAGTKDAGPPSFTRLEMLALSAIAYQQPVTRAELSRLAGHDISRDILGRLKSLGVIAPGPRAPNPARRSPGSPPSASSKSSRSAACAICPISTRWKTPGPVRARNDEIEAALDDAFGLDDEESADEDDALRRRSLPRPAGSGRGPFAGRRLFEGRQSRKLIQLSFPSVFRYVQEDPW